MKSKERLVIKNFGPIVEADIEIKPFMVFIGESGSGKSMILKLLSLFRWIYKRISLRELSKQAKVSKEIYRFRIERMIRESGLDDFCIKGSKAYYYMDDFCVSICCDDKVKLNIPRQNLDKITLEKISFITDDRFAISMLSNNEIRGTMPYHLEKTFEDFSESFEHLQENKKIKIKTFNIELSKEKYGIQNRFFLNSNTFKIQLHNASSGMKSVSIIEPIASYFTIDNEYMRDKFRDFAVGLFINFKSQVMDSLFDDLRNITIKSLEKKDRFSLFIEEPEISLFPNSQKRLVEYLVNLCFYANVKREIFIAFSTHSPYILSSLNCLLLAYEVGKKSHLKEETEKIIPKNFWLDISKFNAFKVENGKVESIIDKETNLILADKIDEVSEEIATIFDSLLDLQYK